jgi:hypothetical protein
VGGALREPLAEWRYVLLNFLSKKVPDLSYLVVATQRNN